ncbi:MAG: hypothetical protein V4473_00455 [Patescibacteria group bacterium]
MKNKNTDNQQGFISLIIIVIIALIFLHYKYNFDILAFFKSPEMQKFLGTLKSAVVDLYGQLKDVIKYIVEKIK